MHHNQQDKDDETRNLHRLAFAFLAGFFVLFVSGFFISPSFNALVGQAFGGLHEAVVTMVAWCRSL